MYRDSTVSGTLAWGHIKAHWIRDKREPPKFFCLTSNISKDEKFIVGTWLKGFVLWNVDVIESTDGESGLYVLKLPSSTRNIQTKMNKSTTCVLSAKNVYAIAGN